MNDRNTLSIPSETRDGECTNSTTNIKHNVVISPLSSRCGTPYYHRTKRDWACLSPRKFLTQNSPITPTEPVGDVNADSAALPQSKERFSNQNWGYSWTGTNETPVRQPFYFQGYPRSTVYQPICPTCHRLYQQKLLLDQDFSNIVRCVSPNINNRPNHSPLARIKRKLNLPKFKF